MDASKAGVHATHCCAKCGCKYADDDCPVVLGTVAAVYGCEDCARERNGIIDALREMTEDERKFIYDQVAQA